MSKNIQLLCYTYNKYLQNLTLSNYVNNEFCIFNLYYSHHCENIHSNIHWKFKMFICIWVDKFIVDFLFIFELLIMVKIQLWYAFQEKQSNFIGVFLYAMRVYQMRQSELHLNLTHIYLWKTQPSPSDLTKIMKLQKNAILELNYLTEELNNILRMFFVTFFYFDIVFFENL